MLRDVLERFGKETLQRALMAQRLDRIHRIAVAAGHVARFIVFGSFVTAKPDPNDVDIFLLMDDGFDSAKLRGGLQLLFDHAVAQAHLGASVFWLRRSAALGGEQETIEHWQTRRDGRRRGIVEIIKEVRGDHDRKRQ